MRLFYVEKIDPSSKTCIIKGSEARHIYKVLRMDVGDILFLMDGKGKRYRAVIKKIEHGSVYVKIEGAFESPEDPPVKIILCISLIRSDPFDLVIQKTSELGVDTIQPFYSERTIVRIPEERLKERMRHWNEVAKSAAKQCGRKKPINLLEPVFLDELLERIRDDKALKIFLWEKEEKISIKSVLKGSDCKKIIGIIGPEGGFSKSEVEKIKKANIKAVSLGKRMLRSETAAIAFSAIVQYELGDIGSIL